jgi:hypothetical protein
VGLLHGDTGVPSSIAWFGRLLDLVLTIALAELAYVVADRSRLRCRRRLKYPERHGTGEDPVRALLPELSAVAGP